MLLIETKIYSLKLLDKGHFIRNAALDPDFGEVSFGN